MKTPMTDMFGIDVPIFAFTHCRDVVAAVTKAGGLGVLGAVAHSPQQLEIDLEWIKDEIGDRPFGVDLIVPAKYAGSDAGGLNMGQVRDLIPPETKAFLDDLMERYGVPPLADDEGTGLGRGGDDRAARSLCWDPCGSHRRSHARNRGDGSPAAAAWAERILSLRPSNPTRYPRSWALISTSFLSWARAGILAKNLFCISLPSL